MEGVVYKSEGPKPFGMSPSRFTDPTKVGLEVGYGQSRRRNIIQQILAPDSTSTAFQRCFSQFDRITQTRQGRSLNKYQRCSQSVLMAVTGGNSTVGSNSGQGREARSRNGLSGYRLPWIGKCKQNQIRYSLQSTLAEICTGPTAVCKCSPRTGTYVEWGPEYTLLVSTKRGKGWKYAKNKEKEIGDGIYDWIVFRVFGRNDIRGLVGSKP